MVTPAEYGLAVGKFASSHAPRLILDFFKRRKLKAAYRRAAERVIGYYQANGYPAGTPSWHGIVNLIRDPRCVEALSVGGRLGTDEMQRLRAIYARDDPSQIRQIVTIRERVTNLPGIYVTPTLVTPV